MTFSTLCPGQKFFSILVLALFMSPGLSGTIIFLNGTSSAGKSSIASELLKMFDEHAKVITLGAHINRIKFEIAQQKESKRSVHPTTYEDGQAIRQAAEDRMYKEIIKFHTEGKNIIIDLTLSKPNKIQLFLNALHDLPVFFVLVYCPLNKLIEHIVKRNQLGIKKEYRTIPFVLNHFCEIYKKRDPSDPCSIDCLKKDDCKRLITATTKTGSNMSKIFTNFWFNKREYVEISALLAYDCIVNTGTSSAQECAQQIQKLLCSPELAYSAIKKNCVKFLKNA